MSGDGGALMSVAQARAVLGPELAAQIEARPRTPLSPEQIARIAPILRAALDDHESSTTAA